LRCARCHHVANCPSRIASHRSHSAFTSLSFTYQIMQITVRYFASVREQLGASEVCAWPADQVAPAPQTVGDLRTWLTQRSVAHAQALDAGKALRTAFNQTLCGADQVLADGAEVAFFPPVTGG
jgi:molybdopterin synthase sulfur carrier subunit